MRVLQFQQRTGRLGDQQKGRAVSQGAGRPARRACGWTEGWLGRPESGGGGQQEHRNREKRHGDTRRRMKMRWETGQTVMDSCKRIYHDIENEEIYLWLVVVVTEMRRFARKISPEVCRKPNLFL